MQGKINVVPAPRSMRYTGGSVTFSGFRIVDRTEFAAVSIQRLSGLERDGGLEIHVKRADLGAEGYRLSIERNGVFVECADKRALHYAVLTLCQVASGSVGELPELIIEDAPDFETRGFMLDISRNKVPKLATLEKLVDILSDLKVIMFQLYVEGRSFYYGSKSGFYADPEDFLTPDDVTALKQYCEERFIELVPCANSLGHMAYWLNQPQYADLAFDRNGFEWWEDGLHAPAGTLDPKNTEAKRFLFSLFDELLAPYGGAVKSFNIGGDEPFDMLFGKNKLDDGGETYFDHIRAVCDNVRARGITPMLWGDIAHKYPEKLGSLGDAVFLEWRYEAGEFDDEACAVYADRGLKFFVCPSSSLCSFTGKTDNMLANIAEAAHYGKKHGAAGLMNTEWGDGGTSQSLVSSVYCMSVGACRAWSAAEFDISALERWLDENVYGCRLAAVTADLGRYVNCQTQPLNGLPYLFSALYIRQTDGINYDRNNFSDPMAFFWRDELLTKAECDATEAFLRGVRERFDALDKPNNAYVREAEYCLDITQLAVMHTRLCLGIKNINYTRTDVKKAYDLARKCVAVRKKLWRERNKKSDMALSMYRYEMLVKKYAVMLRNIK